MRSLAGVGAALKGMFRLKPNNPSYNRMLEQLDELKEVSARARDAAPDIEFHATMQRISKAMKE